MSNLDLVSKKKGFNVVVIAVAILVIVVGAASFCLSTASASPTMSNLAGTYSSTTGYTIVLYANGTGVFSTHVGTWSILNDTTFEGIYTIIIGHTDYFTITDNGFIAVSTGNVYVKETSASPTPTENPAPSTSPTLAASASPTPTAPEFSTATLALIVTMIAIATCTIALAAKKAKKTV